MSYAVKEIYYTLQGEGAQSGRPAVFLRFSGCNLWSGREADRANAACSFCDTDFVGTDGPGGGTFATENELVAAVRNKWPNEQGKPLVVCTGGEPLLQLRRSLIKALQGDGFEVAIETNGTITAPEGIDWICVSPKAGQMFVQKSGDELKLIFPQAGLDPADLVDLDFEHFFLQPMDGPVREQNTQKAIEYCLEHPTWKLSLQSHKLIGIP